MTGKAKPDKAAFPHPPRRRARRLRAMLRPAVQHQLPPELRADRVGRLAGALPRNLHDPGLPALLSKIHASPFLGGNQVQVFTRGEDAMTAMCQEVGRAEREVLLESYIFKDDRTGLGFLHEIARAAQRGVTVRVIADAVGSFSTRSSFWLRMAAQGIQARLFHPFLSKIWAQAYRDHRKILVVDRKVAFTGGMNISEEAGSPFLGLKRRRSKSWRDTHVRVEGPTAWELAVVFREGWEEAGGERFVIPALEETEAPGARILTADSAPGRGCEESAAVLAAIVGAARRNVFLTNAYFAPNRTAIRVLVAAAGRGVDVRLLLPGKTDHDLVRHASHGFYSELLEGGVRIFEYQPSILHAKTLVADGQVAVVGSANLDFRSFLFNSECNLVILEEETAATLERTFEEDLERSREIRLPRWRRRPFYHRIYDRAVRLLAPLL